jgi:hypothetical protein
VKAAARRMSLYLSGNWTIVLIVFVLVGRFWILVTIIVVREAERSL